MPPSRFAKPLPAPTPMNRLDPTSLQLFVRVAEEGTIAAAAEREHIAAPAVSKRLSELEATLGTRLLRRTNKGVEPTDAGRELLALARRALHELDQIPAQLQCYQSGVRGLVRLAASMSAITQFLPGDLRTFLAAHPDVHLQLQERSSSDVLAAVAEESADIGIYTAAAHGEALESRPYRQDSLVLCLPPGHPQAGRRDIDFREILEENIVGMRTGTAIDVLLRRAASLAERPLAVSTQVTSFDAMCTMVHSGFGIGILPEAIARRNAGTLGLAVVPLTDDWARRTFRVCTRRTASPTVAAERLVAHLVACAAAIAPPLPNEPLNP